jgi:ureidoacrylate peracid hydrolase
MKIVGGREIFSELGEILQPKHTALLLVDMQNDFCRTEGWMARRNRDLGGVEAMIPRLARLLEAARSAGVFVVFVKQTTLPDAASDPPGWLYFKTRDGRTETDYTLDGSWGQQIIEELAPRPTEQCVKKFRPSAFHGTSLDLILRTAGIQSTVLAGVITQGCVLASTLDASFHGYYTVLAEDCVASFSAEQHNTSLKFLRSRYDLAPAESLISIGGWR